MSALTPDNEMKIALLELHDWEEKYLRGRIDQAQELVAFPEILEDKQLASIADAENIASFVAGTSKNVLQ
jgi:hypothetical protein